MVKTSHTADALRLLQRADGQVDGDKLQFQVRTRGGDESVIAPALGISQDILTEATIASRSGDGMISAGVSFRLSELENLAGMTRTEAQRNRAGGLLAMGATEVAKEA